jgi:hypothetical protein
MKPSPFNKLAEIARAYRAMPNSGAPLTLSPEGVVGNGLAVVSSFDTAREARAALRDAGFVENGRLWKIAPMESAQRAAEAEGWEWDEGGPHFFRYVPGASPFAPYQYEHLATCDWRELCRRNDIPVKS